jgi:hypothetical protein
VIAASSAVIARAGDSGCPKVAEEGNAVGLRNSRRRRRTQARDTVACGSGRVLRSVLRPVLVNPHYAPSGQTAGGGASSSVSRLGKPAQAGGTNTGVVETDGARLAAHHCSKGRRDAYEKEGGRGHRPCEEERAQVWLPARRYAVAEVSRRRLTSNKLGIRAPKRAAGSSERGSSPAQTVRSEILFGCGERKVRRGSGSSSPLKAVTAGRRPRVARERHSAVGPSPQAVFRSRDRGGKRHRILRRVPTDGRHPGPERGESFHELALAMVSAVHASPDPHQPVKTRACGQDKEAGNAGEARRGAGDERRIATGVSEARPRARRGKTTPTLDSTSPMKKANGGFEFSVARRSAEAVSKDVKPSDPRIEPRGSRRGARPRTEP